MTESKHSGNDSRPLATVLPGSAISSAGELAVDTDAIVSILAEKPVSERDLTPSTHLTEVSLL
jgi:hypothetical protein